MASPAITVSHDRPVGGLDNLPLPPHHATPTQQRLFRSDSDMSQSSTASSVPRSSSFTRNKRFLTGDGLSAREALGIIDEPNAAAVQADSITRLHNFHVARAAMHAVLGHGSSDHSRPPPPPPDTQCSGQTLHFITSVAPPRAPPPPPLPRQPLLSRLVFGEEHVPVTPLSVNNHHHSASVESSPSPQSPESISSPGNATVAPIKMHPFSMSSPKLGTPEKPRRRMRRILSSTGTRQKYTKGADPASQQVQKSPAPDALKTRSSSQSQAVPRSKTFARLLAFFSSPDVDMPPVNSKSSKIVPAEESQNPVLGNDQLKGKKRVEARCVPSLRPNDRLDAKTSLSQIGKSDVGHKVFNAPEKAAEARGIDEEDNVYLSDDDSSLSNIADLLVREQPLFRRESRSTSNTALSDENSGPAHDADKKSVAVTGESPANPFSRAPVAASSSHRERVVTPPKHSNKLLATIVEQGPVSQQEDISHQSKASQNKLREDYAKGESSTSSDHKDSNEKPPLGAVQAAVRKLEWMEKNAARSFTKGVPNGPSSIATDDNLSFTSAAEDFSSVKEPEIKKDEKSDKTAPEDIENEAQNSPQPSVESPTVESVTTSSSGNSRADRYCEHPGAVPSASDTYKLRTGDTIKFPDSRGQEMSQRLRTSKSPILHYDIPPGVNAHDFLDGPIASAVVEEGTEAQRNRRDSHAAFLRSDENHAPAGKLADGADLSENKLTAAEGTDPAPTGIRKMKSGLGHRIAATAKKLPRGGSFPRLRSWGEQFAPESKPVARSMSLSKNGTTEGGRSLGVRDPCQNKELTGVSKDKAPKESDKKMPHRDAPKPSGDETMQAAQEYNRGPTPKLRGSVPPKRDEGTAFRPSGSEKRRVVPTLLGKKKPHEDMLCISKLAPENFIGDTEHKAKDLGYRRPLPRPKTIARAVADSNKEIASVDAGVQDGGKVSSKSTGDVTKTGDKLVAATPREGVGAKEMAAVDYGRTGTRGSDAEAVRTKASPEGSQDEFRSGAGVVQDGDMVTVERVIRRTRADGSSETVRKKIRLRAERVLENGDVVVRRTLQRLKEDGSGCETVTISQVIPRRKKMGATRVEKDENRVDGESGRVGISLPNLETAKEEVEVEVENGMLRGGIESDGADRTTGGLGERGGDAGGSLGRGRDGKLGVGGWGRMWSFQGKEGSRRLFWRR